MGWGLAGTGNSSAAAVAPQGVGVKIANTLVFLKNICEKMEKQIHTVPGADHIRAFEFVSITARATKTKSYQGVVNSYQ